VSDFRSDDAHTVLNKQLTCRYAKDSQQFEQCINQPGSSSSVSPATPPSPVIVPPVAWEDAPACNTSDLSAACLAKDTQGRCWGYENGTSCAYKFPSNGTTVPEWQIGGNNGSSTLTPPPPPSPPANATTAGTPSEEGDSAPATSSNSKNDSSPSPPLAALSPPPGSPAPGAQPTSASAAAEAQVVGHGPLVIDTSLTLLLEQHGLERELVSSNENRLQWLTGALDH
jgi:hypothetical protein